MWKMLNTFDLSRRYVGSKIDHSKKHALYEMDAVVNIFDLWLLHGLNMLYFYKQFTKHGI